VQFDKLVCKILNKFASADDVPMHN